MSANQIYLDMKTYEKAKAEAEKHGMSVLDWVKGLIGKATEQTAEAPAVPVEAVKPAESPAPVSAPDPAAPAAPARFETGHPCVYLVRVMPPNFGANHCEGTCKNPRQRGAPCFFNAATAKNCRAFEPLVRARIPPPRHGERGR